MTIRSVDDNTTMETVLRHADSTTTFDFMIPPGRGKRKAESQGNVTKARMGRDRESYLTGSHYDKLIQNPKLVEKFKTNRKFLNQLVDCINVNLITPHCLICFVCGTDTTLADTGILNDFKKHLKRHQVEASADAKRKATALLSRWAELDLDSEEVVMTEVPLDLLIKKSHPGMVCLNTLEGRRRDPTYNVLHVHGQSTISDMLSKKQ